MAKTISEQYIPGVCNIGPAEMAKRRQAGFVGVLTTVILAITLVSVGASRTWRLTIFIPVFAAAIGYLQNAFHFCVGFGLKGLYNVINSAGQTEDISKAEFRELDKKKAQKLSILV